MRQPEMDCGLVVDERDGGATVVRTVPVSDVKAGDAVVCGAHGVRVELPPAAPRGEEEDFGFMSSAVSSEKPQALLVRQIAERMREVKAAGQRMLWVGGPAVVHTGAAPAMVRLVRAGYVDVLFAGNALATHDIESALFGTSLGRRPGQGLGRAARARAPHPGDQHDPGGRLDRRGGGVRRPHRRRDARDGAGRTSRSCWSARCATTARCPTSTPT